MHLTKYTKFKIFFRTLKTHEVILFYLAVSTFWHYIFSAWLDLLPNMKYLEYPATAATTLQLIKWLDPREIPGQGKFLGACVSRSSLLEILFVAVISVAIGVGAWSLLVFLEAKFISPTWSYRFWDLIDADSFNSIKWSPSWLVADMISVALVGPISEEIVFRGLILRNLLKKYSIKNSILISSAIFSLFHINHSFLGAFVHSVIFSILALRLCSIYASIIVHGLYNFSTTILRLMFGISLVADKFKIENFSYWKIDLFLFGFGLSLGFVYIYFYIKNPQLKSSSFIPSPL